MSQILTFGYGNRKDYSNLIEYINDYQIDLIVDVRLRPKAWSRIWYGSALKQFCQSQNIRYMGEPRLGNISGNAAWEPPCQESANLALECLSRHITRGSIVMLLCAELDYRRCHRTDVAKRLSEMNESKQINHLR